MRPITLDVDPDAANAAGLADGNDSTTTSVTLDGTLTSGGAFTSADGLAHRLNITDAGADDQSTATYTVTGTDALDNELIEALSGPASTATVETIGYFKTVSSIAIASPVATSTVDIGTVDEVETAPIPLNWRSEYGANISVNVTGTLNFTVQETFVEIQKQTPFWVDLTALTAKTADTTSSSTVGATAYKFRLNSYSTGAEAQVYTTQSDG